jgi:hypothetical protein
MEATFLCTQNLFRLMAGRTPNFMTVGTTLEATIATVTITATLHRSMIHTQHPQFMLSIVTAIRIAVLDQDLLLPSRQYTENLIVGI